MGIRACNAEILRELRKVAGDRTLLQRHIMEWSTGEIKPHEGETVFYLPTLRVNVAVKK